MTSYNPDAIILANGRFPSREEIVSLLKTGKPVVCCDGASAHLFQFGIKPTVVIGDMDSIKPEIRTVWNDIVIHNPDQNTNDLTKSIDFCNEKNWKKLLILGATGLREDHTIANISLLHKYLEQLEQVVMISDYGTITPINSSSTFTSFYKQQVSIISLTPRCRLSTEGLKYPLVKMSLPSLWNGSLNESTGKEFRITLHQMGNILVYQTHDAK
jgi:thiamine pyrophosphokinase